MGQVLIWILLLTTLLLLHAAFSATAYRRRRRAARAALLAIGWVPSILLLVAIAIGPAVMAYFMPVYQPLAWFCAAMLPAFVIGILLIRRRAKRDPADQWPAGRLWLACAVSAALLAMTLWNLDLQSRLRIQGYRAEAGMLLLSVAPPQVSETENAAIVYEQAFALMKQDRNFDAALNSFDQQISQAGEFLDRHKNALALIRRAADMPQYRPDQDYSRPSIELMLPQLSQMRAAARTLAVAARYSAQRGDIPSAIQDVNRLHAMSNQVGTAPILVCNLVGIGIAALGHQTLMDVLPKVTSAEQLAPIQYGTPSAWRRRATRALRGEFAFGIGMMCDMASGVYDLGGNTKEYRSPQTGIFLRLFVFEPDMLAYQDYMRGISAAASDPNRNLTDMRSLMPSVDQVKQGLFTSILVPSLDRYLVQVSKAQASDEMARVAVAVTRYRLDHGAYPKTAGQLVPDYIPAMPLDPQDNQPIRLVLRDEGLVIYSVGEDNKDDGGEVDTDLHAQGKPPRDFGLILRTRPKMPMPEM